MVLTKKSSLLSVRAALDRHLRLPPHDKKFSVWDLVTFQEANKILHSCLKHLMTTGKIAETVKTPLTPESHGFTFLFVLDDEAAKIKGQRRKRCSVFV